MNVGKWEDIVRLNYALELYTMFPITKARLNPAGSHWTHTKEKATSRPDENRLILLEDFLLHHSSRSKR